MKTRATVFFVSVLIVILVGSCTDNDTNPTGPQNSSNTLFWGNYLVKGDTLAVFTASSITTNRECKGDTLVSSTSTNEADTSLLRYQVEGRTLRLTQIDDSISTGIRQYVLEKTSGGPGLSGSWKYDRVVFETGVSVSIEDLSDTVSIINQLKETTVSFVAGQLKVSSPYMDLYLAQLNTIGWQISWAFTGWMYSVEKSDTIIGNRAGFVLVGKIANETVTILWDKKGDCTYYSSISSHAAHVVHADPVACPNSAPDWYTKFLKDNATLAKCRPQKPYEEDIYKKRLLFPFASMI